MNAPRTFSDLISAWGIGALAHDLGLKYVTVQAMRRRNSIASRYWPRIIECAPANGFSLTADDLLAMAAGKVAA